MIAETKWCQHWPYITRSLWTKEVAGCFCPVQPVWH